MKIILSGDWQATLTNLNRCDVAVGQICSVLKSYPGAKYFVHTGDIKENFNPVDVRVTNFIIESQKKIKAVSQGFYFCRGNHDSITTQDGVPSCAPLVEALGANHVADQNWTVSSLNFVSLFMVPYFRSPELQKKMWAEAAKEAAGPGHRKRTRILVFHNEIKGCEKTAYVQGEGYTLDDLRADKYNICVGGHIHRPQLLKPNVYFAGSPFCMDWGEVNERKSIFVIDIDDYQRTLTVQRIPSRLPGWYDPKAPGFSPPTSWAGTRVRINVPIQLDQVREMNEARERYTKKYEGAELHLVPDFAQSKLIPASKVDVTGSDEKILESYLSKVTLPSGVTSGQIIAYLKRFLPSFSRVGVRGLKFGELVAEDVLSFQKVQFNFDRKGLTVLTGQNLDWSQLISNGAGKSGFVTLPCLALLGRTFKGQVFDQWARQNTNNPARLTQTFTLPDKRKLKIERGRRPALLRVWLDKDEVTMGDSNATQALIERLTNLTWSVLTNAIYIGQREIGSVFGTDKDRKELFSRLLGLDRFLEAQSKLRDVLTRIRDQVAEVQSDVDNATAALNEAKHGLGEIEDTLRETPEIDAQEVESKKREIQDIEYKIRKNDKEKTDLEPTLQENQKQFESLLMKSGDAEAAIRAYQEQIDSSHKVEGRCYVCGSEVTEDKLEKFRRELKKKIEEQEALLDIIEDKQNKNRTLRRTLIDKIQAGDLENQKLRRTLTAVRTNYDTLCAQVYARQRLELLVKTRRQRAGDLEKTANVHAQALFCTLLEKEFVETCIQVTGRDGVPAYICSVAAPQLNSASSYYSEIFTEGEIGVQFTQDLDIAMVNVHGGAGIKDQSAGEMRMAGLITAMSFRDVLVPHNLLVLDEPSEGLDAANSTAFARGLCKIVNRFQHVIVISHNDRILSGLEPDYHLEVVKQNGISTLHEL